MVLIMELELKRIHFNKDASRDFISVLKERVNNYFKTEKLSARGNVAMALKSVFLVSVVALTYAFILKGFGGGWGVLGLYAFLGFCISICAMNIAHDALHGAYVSRSPGNRILGFVMDLFGGSSFYWKKEHTVDHHTFTNIAEHDGDLNAPFVLRLCPKAPRYSFHRFQHWYAPLLYSLKLFHWAYFSDMKRIYKIFTSKDPNFLKPPKGEVFLMIAFKLLHIFLFLGLPILCLPFPWWQVTLSYFAFLMGAGVTMTTVFQLAHIVENVAFPLPDTEGKIENSFATHQLATTSNFATKSKLVAFLFGGLNFQVEHHLFPHICHTHLYKIAPIVEATAKEFGIPYYKNPTLFSAIRSHFRTLKRFGAGDTVVCCKEERV